MVFAENEKEVERHLNFDKIEKIKNWTIGLNYHSTNDNYTMFDSSRIGFELAENSFLTFNLKSGEYKIKTTEYKPDRNTFLLLHKFELEN